MKKLTITCLAPLIPLASVSCYAETYLSVEQAQKVIFPSAQFFIDQSVSLNEKEIEEISNQAGSEPQVERAQIIAAKDKQGAQLGYMLVDQVIGKHEFITYAVGVNNQKEIIAVEILQYLESYGGEIKNEAWRGQFINKKSSDSIRLARDIQNISGATLSCKHVTEGVKRMLVTLDLLQQGKRIV